MSGEQDWLDYAQKLGPGLSAFASTTAAVIALIVAFRGARRDRREQASRVTACLEDAPAGEELPMLAVVHNASHSAVYEAVVRMVRVSKGPVTEAVPKLGPNDVVDYACKTVLPPGETKIGMKNPSRGMHRRFGVEIAFQDAAGRGWYRSPTGRLTKIKKHPVDYFGMSWPVGWG